MAATRDNPVSSFHFKDQSPQGDRPGAAMHGTKAALPCLRLLTELIRIDSLRR